MSAVVEMTNCRQEPAAWSIKGHHLCRSVLKWPDLTGAGQGPGRVCGSVGVPLNISQLVFPPAEALSFKRVPGVPEAAVGTAIKHPYIGAFQLF